MWCLWREWNNITFYEEEQSFQHYNSPSYRLLYDWWKSSNLISSNSSAEMTFVLLRFILFVCCCVHNFASFFLMKYLLIKKKKKKKNFYFYCCYFLFIFLMNFPLIGRFNEALTEHQMTSSSKENMRMKRIHINV